MKRYDLDRLLTKLVPDDKGAERATHRELAGLVGLSLASVRKAVHRGLSETQADQWAVRCGFLPWQVWPEWMDDVIASCQQPCIECAEPFVPFRKGHRFCSKRCSTRRRKREAYARDADLAARMSEKRRAYYEACKEAEQAQIRRWKAANPEKVRAYNREYMRRWRARKAESAA